MNLISEETIQAVKDHLNELGLEEVPWKPSGSNTEYRVVGNIVQIRGSVQIRPGLKQTIRWWWLILKLKIKFIFKGK